MPQAIGTDQPEHKLLLLNTVTTFLRPDDSSDLDSRKLKYTHV